MKTKTLKLIYASLLAVITLSSCDTSFFDENEIKDPEFNLKGLPIGYVTYQAGDLFKNIGDGLETSETDGLTTFSYTQNLNTFQSGEYIDIENINIPTKEVEFKSNIDMSTFPGSPTEITASTGFPFNQFLGTFDNDPDPFNQSVNLEDVDITYSNFKTGNLTMVLRSSYDAKAKIDIEIPSIRNLTDKTPFKTTVNFNGNGTLADLEVKTINISLSDYEIDYTYLVSGNTYNNEQTVSNLVVDANTSVTIEAGDVIRKSDVIRYKVDFSNLKPNLIKGDMSDKKFSVDNNNTEIPFDFFTAFPGIKNFKPVVTLDFDNSQGLPLAIDLSNIKAVNSVTKAELALQITDDSAPELNGNKAILGSALIDSNNNITEKKNKIILNNNNSNIGDLLAINPDKFVISINTADINPNGETENFFDIDEIIKVKLGIEIPLDVRFENVAFESEFDKFDTIELDDKATSVSLRIETFNAIPLSGKIDLTFMDIAGNVKITKSLDVIQEAAIDASGNSIYEVTDDKKLRNKNTGDFINGNIATLSFNLKEIQDLKNVKKIKSSITLDSSTDVKLRNTDKLHLKLAMAGDLKISSKS